MKRFVKGMLSVLLSASIIFAPVVPALAVGNQSGAQGSQQSSSGEAGTENPDAQTVGAGETADQPPTRDDLRMAGYEMPVDTNSLTGWPQGPSVYGYSAIVMDMNSEGILFGKNIDEKRYPASITKLLTALVALENSDLTDEVAITSDSISCLSYGDAHIGMTPGEVITMEDALYALLLASANEVAHAIGETVGAKLGGDYDTFIQAMNDKAEELGCTGSHWTNTNGLHDAEHYTTVHDMALIAEAVYQHEEFRKITQTLNYTIPPTNLVDESRTFQQKHKMLWSGNDNYYPYATGGKTGYTDDARTTLVTMADNGELQLAAVVMFDFGADAYVDTTAMFEYVFHNFSKVSLNDQEKPEEIQSFTDPDAYLLLPEGIRVQDLDAQVTMLDEQTGDALVTYTYEGWQAGTARAKLTSEYLLSLRGLLSGADSSEDESVNPDAGPESGQGEESSSGGALAVFSTMISSVLSTEWTLERQIMAAGGILLGVLLLVLLIVSVRKIRQGRRIRKRRQSRKRRRNRKKSGKL